jgi:flagellar L-ring protein precursor FlgH
MSMKVCAGRIGFVVVFCLASAAAARCQSLWTEGSRSLIADHRAAAVGDIVTIVVVERSLASHEASHETKKAASAGGGPGSGILAFFPELGYQATRSTTGEGATSQSTQLVDRVSARVAAVTPEGNLRIEATRRVKLDKDEVTLRLSGLARPDDVTAENTILSTQLADCTIEWSGRGPVSEKQRPGLISALLSWLW